MIKIVRIIARLNIGGPTINAVLLSEGFNNSSFQTILVAGSIEKSEGDMSYFAEQKGIRPIFVPELGRKLNLFRDLKAFWKIYRIIKKEQPNIVHTHTAKAGTLGRVAAILAGVSVKVHTFHGHVFDGYFNSLATNIFIAVEGFLARFTDKIIVVSKSVADDVSIRYNIVPRDKIAVVPLGFELGSFFESHKNKGKLRQELGLGNDVLLIGIIGRLVPIKNHKMFLDAIKQLTAYPLTGTGSLKLKAIIVGDGELHQELENYAAELGIKDKLLFLGWRRDLENIYADLDIVCMTSLNEGTPVSLIEAMASGRPVIATDVGGVKDIVKDGINGRLVTSGDINGFSIAALDLLNNNDMRIKMGNNGREFVRKHFNKERLIEDTKNLYEDLLKATRHCEGRSFGPKQSP